ncbi:MAG: hypothetical protein V7745_06265 [Pseudomonadales bacterium]
MKKGYIGNSGGDSIYRWVASQAYLAGLLKNVAKSAVNMFENFSYAFDGVWCGYLRLDLALYSVLQQRFLSCLSSYRCFSFKDSDQ